MAIDFMSAGGAVLDTTTAGADDIKSGKTAYNGEGELVTGTYALPSTTAGAGDILKDKTAVNSSGTLLTGTMVNNGRWPDAEKLTLEGSKIWMYKTSGYTEGGLGIDASNLGNASPGHVLSGVSASSSNGLKFGGTMTNRGAWNSSVNPGGSVTIPAGYHNGSGKVSATTAGVKNIKTKSVNTGNIGNRSYSYKVTEGTLIGLTGLQVHHWHDSSNAVVNYYIGGNTIHIDTAFAGGNYFDINFTFAYY